MDSVNDHVLRLVKENLELMCLLQHEESFSIGLRTAINVLRDNDLLSEDHYGKIFPFEKSRESENG